MNAIKFVSKIKNIYRFSSILSRKITSTRNICSFDKIINETGPNVVPIVTVVYRGIDKKYSTNAEELVDSITYEKVCEETLESLNDYFEELVEETPHLKDSDVCYGSGVLTVNFGQPYGTYVINRQSPNRQIWLSSPTSGPKRYDFSVNQNYWIYKHDNISLHQLLQEEIKKIVKKEVDFGKCSYSFVSS